MHRRSSTTTKVFVGSLPTGTTTDELRDLFAPYGDIAECDVVNRCGFLHLENKSLAFKAIQELNNTTFKGTRISVEKGRQKPPPGRDGGGRGARNGFGGPMRGGRDGFRGTPYMRDGGDYDRRGPPRPMGGGNGYGGRGGYDRGFDNRQPPNMLPPSRPMTDGYNGGPDRRPYMDDRPRYPDDRRYPDSGYMGPGGDNRMYPEERSIYPDDRRPMMDDRRPVLDDRQPPMDQRPSFDRRPMMDDRRPMDDRPILGERRGGGPGMDDRRPMMDDRRPMMNDRRPLMDPQAPAGLGASPGGGGMHPPMPQMQNYDRRPQQDMYSRRDVPPKPMGGGYNDAPRNQSYDSAYPPLQQRGDWNYSVG